MKNNIINLQRAAIVDNKLAFEDGYNFDKAIQDGFFLLKIPVGMQLTPGIQFSRSFYKDATQHDQYTGYKSNNDIYFDRAHFQTEHILADQYARARHFPEALNELCNEMNDIGIAIFHSICTRLNIPESDRYAASGGAIKNEGTHWFASSHYRTHIRKPGCAAHKDTGFVTVLYIEQGGLQAYIDNNWVDIDPVEGYFVINFGASLEILTAHLSTPVKAIYHRVKEMQASDAAEDRYSFAAFLNPPPGKMLYQYDAEGVLQDYMPVQKFLDEFNKTVWNDSYEQFGIKTHG